MFEIFIGGISILERGEAYMISFKHRIISGVGANIFGQSVTVWVQLFSLPMFLHHWGASLYGEWIMLSAIPVIFSLADVGLVTVAMNKMTMLSSKGKAMESCAVFQSALLFVSVVVILIGIFAALLIANLSIPLLNLAGRKSALMILVVVALLNIYTALFSAIFRAGGKYAFGVFLLNCGRIAEWLGAIGGLIIDGSFVGVAIGSFAGRALATFILFAICKKNFTQFVWSYSLSSLKEIKSMVRPGLSVMLFPVGSAISIQGITLLVGGLFGPVSVTLFSAYRTVARVVVQLVGAYSQSISPEFSRIYGVDSLVELKRLYRHSMKVSVIITFAAATMMYFSFPWIMETWTDGKINYVSELASMFVVYTILSSLWLIPKMLVISINRHETLSTIYLITCAASIIFAWLFSNSIGIYAAILSLVMQEFLMLFVSAKEARKVN